jgi:phosphoglycolate phosphatase
MTLNKKLPKAVIFDWDNTLVDTWPLIQVAIDTTMEQMGKEPWGLEKVKNEVHASMRESFPKIFGDNWEKAGEIYKKSYRENHLDKLVFLPGATQLLDKLLELNITLIIISNKIGTTLRKEAGHMGVSDKFFSIVGSTDAARDKPHKEPVDLALQNSELDPKRDLIWFVGDTITDVECAAISECQPVLYGEGRNVPKDLIVKLKKDPNKPILCFDDHFGIVKHIEECSQ